MEKATLKPPVLKKQARALATPSVMTWDATERSVRVKVAMPADAAKVHELAVLLDGRIVAAPVLMTPVEDRLTINFGSTEDSARESKALEEAVNDAPDSDSTTSED